jgi:hypothetical protein
MRRMAIALAALVRPDPMRIGLAPEDDRRARSAEGRHSTGGDMDSGAGVVAPRLQFR